MAEEINTDLSERGDISDDISYLVLEMHGDIKKIEQHLQEITNSIESNSNQIENNRNDLNNIEEEVQKVDTKMKIATGLATVIATAAATTIPQFI